MSVNLNVSAMKYKDPSTGEYKDIAGVLGGGTTESPVQDVQINGTSILDAHGVANVPIANLQNIQRAELENKPIASPNAYAAAFYGLAKATGDTTQSQSSNVVGNYTDNAKSAIHEMLNGSVAVTGTTPTITALPGIRYVCGEVATLDVTLPASGIVDVVFESGSTPTVLTVTGVTWPEWFDPTTLEANRTYEISIADGFGAVMSWA